MKAKEIKKSTTTNYPKETKPIVLKSSSIKKIPFKKGGCCGKEW
ncbi:MULTISPECIES: hypothetical protein [Clostridia]|nr:MULTISPECIES: hypothetical protein [Clostridia]